MINNIATTDPEIYQAIELEAERQDKTIELIASENFTSKAVQEAQGSVMTNKYAEGYVAKRYYNGCEAVDIAEKLAISRALELFNCAYANVQPHSGSQANQAVFLSLLSPGDVIMGQSLNSGGHLTHGSHVNMSGKWFHGVSYEVDKTTYLIDYDEVLRLALAHKPKLIIAGCSAYSRIIDFAKFREIADKVGSYLLVDMAHIAGLVASGVHPSPLSYADVVTTTTHKTLRGPRGGLILSNDLNLGKKIDSAIFPGMQGGPLMHVIAAKAIAFKEALSSEFKDYSNQIVLNAKALAASLMNRGYEILTQGTDNHMILLDLRKQGITGKDAANALERANLTCNKNNIPFDSASPFITSGIRLGTPACTTRGFKQAEFLLVGEMIADILDNIDQVDIIESVKKRAIDLITKFPIS